MTENNRSRFQFGLGTLLAGVTWLALALGLCKWFGWVWGVVPVLFVLVCLAAVIHCAYFRRPKRLALLLLVFGGAWLAYIVGYWGLVAEPGGILEDGLLVLNVEGAGYRKGDVVWINTRIDEITRGDVVLF